MNWRSPKFAYPLTIASLIACVSLQAVWLHQLFVAQKTQLKGMISTEVGEASKISMFNSLADNKAHSPTVRAFFYSPQWLEMREAFDGLQINNVHSVFNYGIDADSSFVEMKFAFRNVPPAKAPKKANKVKAIDVISVSDSLSLNDINRQVRTRLDSIGVHNDIYYAVYNYDNGKLTKSLVPASKMHTIVYASKIYSFNLKHKHKFQLLITDLTIPVLYRMRYYIISSILMLAVTVVAFYFIIVLLRKQKLYADAKLSFTSNMTHEFKTPVSTVSIALESIRKYNLINDPEKLNHYIDICRSEMGRLDMMIEKVLNLNVGDNSLQPLKTELLDIQLVLQQVLVTMRLALDNVNAMLIVNFSEVPCFINGDPVHLSNVFYNLVDNAIKYADKPLILEVACEHQENGIVISFSDNGPGISKSFHSNIFDKFFRVPTSGDTHNVKGSGLGLYYVKEIMTEHRGSITIKSDPGSGSKFIIRLPSA